MLHGIKGTRQESSADQKDKAERDLRDDERAVPTETASAWRSRSAALSQGFLEVRSCAVPGGKHAAQHAGDEGDGAAEDEHTHVNADRVQPRQVGRSQFDERSYARNGERDTETRAEQRKDPRLDQNLSRHPATAGSERSAYRVFTRPRDRPSEREAGDVAAGDEEDTGNRAEDGQQHGPGTADDVVDQGTGSRAPASVRVRELLLVESGQAIQFSVRLLDGHTASEAGDGVEPPEVPIEVGRVEAEWNPEVCSLPVWKGSLSSTDVLEARRHDADDDKRPAREVDRASDNGGIGAEPRAPDPIAQDDAVGSARTLVVARECAAERSTRAQQLDEAGGDEQALEILRSGRAPELMALAVEGRGTGEGSLVLAKGVEVHRRQRHVAEPWMLCEDAHQPVGIGVGQRLEEDTAHHAVDRRVAADGEREREGDDSREGRVLRETTYRVERDRARSAAASRRRPAATRRIVRVPSVAPV